MGPRLVFNWCLFSRLAEYKYAVNQPSGMNILPFSMFHHSDNEQQQQRAERMTLVVSLFFYSISK